MRGIDRTLEVFPPFDWILPMKFFLVMWRMSKADLRMLWAALKHPGRPRWLLPAAVLLGLYAIAPWNIAIPALGIVDDLVLVPLLLHGLLKLIPQHLFAKVGKGPATPFCEVR
jgi:uncharacterized membrane protein YkvA (DUF1232 family)